MIGEATMAPDGDTVSSESGRNSGDVWVVVLGKKCKDFFRNYVGIDTGF